MLLCAPQVSRSAGAVGASVFGGRAVGASASLPAGIPPPHFPRDRCSATSQLGQRHLFDLKRTIFLSGAGRG